MGTMLPLRGVCVERDDTVDPWPVRVRRARTMALSRVRIGKLERVTDTRGSFSPRGDGKGCAPGPDHVWDRRADRERIASLVL